MKTTPRENTLTPVEFRSREDLRTPAFLCIVLPRVWIVLVPNFLRQMNSNLFCIFLFNGKVKIISSSALTETFANFPIYGTMPSSVRDGCCSVLLVTGRRVPPEPRPPEVSLTILGGGGHAVPMQALFGQAL